MFRCFDCFFSSPKKITKAQRGDSMFAEEDKFETVAATPRKNLADVPFDQRQEIVDIARELALVANDSKDSYTASLPLMINAELGDKEGYIASRDFMLSTLPQNLYQMDLKQAWTGGRLLLSAESMKDSATVAKVLPVTECFLLKNPPSDESPNEFMAWLSGYRAALNKAQYDIIKENMMKYVGSLYKAFSRPNEYWGWVMAIQAAARAQDKELYEPIKKYFQIGTQGKASIEEVLQQNLCTKGDTNYFAWALAKVRLAAATVSDSKLFLELEQPMQQAIAQAKSAMSKSRTVQAKAEYALAVLDNTLANQLVLDRQNALRPRSIRSARRR